MNVPTLAVLALAVLPALACCTPAPRAAAAEEPQAVAPERSKVEAPVEVEAQLAEGTAHVTVRFGSAATGVRVGVSGVDGLVVNGEATLVDGASYARGASAAFDVAFTAGPGRSALAIAVSGVFAGGHRALVRSFAVGAPAQGQEKSGLTVETQDGDRVKIVVPGR